MKRRSVLCKLGVHKWPGQDAADFDMTGEPMFVRVMCRRSIRCQATKAMRNLPDAES